MDSPGVRLVASLAMLALFYWSMLMPPPAHATEAALSDPEVDGLLVASRDGYAREQYDQALRPTEALVARFPTQHVYLERLAVIYQHLGRFHDEAIAWHRFMDLSPTPWDACPAVGNAHAADHDSEGALAAYQMCWDQAPWDPDAAFFLARERERRGEVDEAAALYRQSIEIDKDHADSQLGLARLNLHASRFDEARQAALAIVARLPEHADAHLILAQAAQRSGDQGQARQYFEQTLRIEERYFDAHVGLGILEFSEHRTTAARQHFERALVLDPSRRAEVSVWLDRTEGAQ